MSDLYWLTDEEMARLQPYCPKSHSKTRVDDRRALSSIVFVNRNRYGGVIGRSRMLRTSLSWTGRRDAVQSLKAVGEGASSSA
jgi:hypothetical protein